MFSHVGLIVDAPVFAKCGAQREEEKHHHGRRPCFHRQDFHGRRYIRRRIRDSWGGEAPCWRRPPLHVGCQLSRGAMGEVYRARHITLRNTVALKVLPAGINAYEEAIECFRREA